MGQTVTTREPPVLRVSGATPMEILEIHVVKNNAIVFVGESGGRVFDFTWQDPHFDADVCYYIHVKMAGQPMTEEILRDKPDFAWSSPIWVTRK